MKEIESDKVEKLKTISMLLLMNFVSPHVLKNIHVICFVDSFVKDTEMGSY